MATPRTGRPRGRPKGSKNRNPATLAAAERQRQAEAAAQIAEAEAEVESFDKLSNRQLRALLPKDIFRILAFHYAKSGEFDKLERVAMRWAPYEHATKSDATMAITVEDVRHIAEQARAEAARRGIDFAPAERRPAGTLPN
jgi:hypothetical protein